MSIGSMAVGQAGRETPAEAIGKVWERKISNMPRHRDYYGNQKATKMRRRKKMKWRDE